MSHYPDNAHHASQSQGDTAQNEIASFRVRPGDRFIGIDEVRPMVNLEKTAIYKRIREKRFPRRYPNGWLLSDIMLYIENEVRAQAELPPLKFSHEIMAMQREQRT